MNNFQSVRGFIPYICAMLIAVIFGAMVLEAGALNILSMSDPAQTEEIKQHFENSRDDMNKFDVKQGTEEFGWIPRLIAELTGEDFGYGEDSVYEQLVSYYYLPLLDTFFIVLHIATAGFCMLLAPIQFWPNGRQKWPVLHRRTGWVYTITVGVSMVAAAGYLTTSPVEQIYAGLPFYLLLVMLCVVTSISLFAAIYYASHKNYALHHAFISLNFGMLLSAPLLRVDWAVFGYIFPTSSQMDTHLLGLGMIGAISAYCGYALYIFVRQTQRMGRSPRRLPGYVLRGQKYLRHAFIPLCAVAVLSFLIAVSYSNIWPIQNIQSVSGDLQNQPTTYLRPLLHIATLLSIWAATAMALVCLKQKLDPLVTDMGRQSVLLAGLVFVASILGLAHGLLLGIPTADKIGGGTFYINYGILGVFLASIILVSHLKGLSLIIDDLTSFVIALAFSPIIFFSSLALMELSGASYYNTYYVSSSISFGLAIPAFLGIAFSKGNLVRIAK